MLYPVTELLNARFAAVFDSVIFPIALSDIYRNFVFFRLAIVYTDFFIRRFLVMRGLALYIFVIIPYW